MQVQIERAAVVLPPPTSVTLTLSVGELVGLFRCAKYVAPDRVREPAGEERDHGVVGTDDISLYYALYRAMRDAELAT